MATANTAIKITSLPNIGNAIAPSTLIPVVNMAGAPVTQKANLQITGNLILAGAGTANFVPAGLANLAYSVVNAAQPNITSTGTLNVNTLKVSGGINGQYLQTDGTGNLAWVSGGSSGNGEVGGSNTQIQFNDAGNFNGNTGFTFNKTTGVFASPLADVSGVANIVGGGATVATKSVLTVASTFGSNSSAEPASAQAIRGRVTGANLTKTRNYVTGVTGQYLITGTNASEFIKAGVLGVVGDQTTTADGAVVAYLDGDGGLTTANAAYAVSMKNSTPNSGFNYGLDLQFISLNLGGVTTSKFKQADIRFNNGVTLVANTAGNISINGNLMTSAEVVASGNVSSGTGLSTGGFLSVDGTADLHDTTVTGNLSATGNITAINLGNISAINLTGSNSDVLYGNGVFAPASGGGNANTGNVTFNDINIIGTGNLKLQPDSANASAYLDIFLTAGPDIHIAGNGETVILGTDNFANVAVNINGNVSIQANAGTPYTWNFGTDGTTTFPTANVDIHNGGVQSGEVLQFGNPNLQSIITGPTPDANVNAQRIIIQGQRGNGTGEGGDVYVWAGDADTNGGDIKIYAGDADNVSTGTGGYINLAGGDGFDSGGGITLNGGISANAYGGAVNITGGSGETGGGSASLQGGYGGNGQGGTVQITGGGGNSQAAYGEVEIGSGTYAWLFDNSGNLVLPGNTFAVNYANGTQVSIGGGANTGNVTFNDQVVIGTGSNDGSGGLYLAPGLDSTANLQYLRVRGGDVASHIHFDTGNSDYYDLYIGDDVRSVKIANTGNIDINTSDYSGNAATWTFGVDGNLILAGGNSIVRSVANSSLDTLNPNVSTMIFTPDAGYSSQSLVLDPTAPGHIHLRAPSSNIDEPLANLFLGGEDSSFEVGYYNGAAPNVFIHSGGNTWTFDNTGNITFPRDASNISTDPILTIVGGATPTILSTDASLLGPANLAIVTDYLNLSGSNGNRIAIYADNGEIGTEANMVLYTNLADPGNIVSWILDTTGNLTLPDTTSVIANVSITLEANDTGNITGLNVIGDSHANLYAHGNVTIVSDSSDTTPTWTFGTNGNLTLPQGTTISDATDIVTVTLDQFTDGGYPGTQVFTKVSDTLYELSPGGPYMTLISAVWYLKISVSTYYDSTDLETWGAVAGGLPAPVGTLGTLASMSLGVGGNVWNFDGDGNLTLPANAFAINYANGTQVSLGGSSSNISNGNSNVSIATANGNVTIAAVGNTTMTVTGTGANVTGTLTSTGKIGYASGSTVTQTSNRGNGVNINALAGTIVTVSASMTAGEIGAFSVTNNQVDTNNDIVLVQVVSPNLGNYNVIANPNSGIGGFYLTLQNISGFPISPEAVTIRFMVIKAPNA